LPTLSECHNHRLAAPDAMGGSDADSVQVLNRGVKLYFGCGEAVLVAGANKCLAELAKHCTRMVCDALRAMGVDENKVELKKPEPARADGPANEARRVDVVAK
jgi:K(+)-stimulated pyrophosphate-energized sodium pump